MVPQVAIREVADLRRRRRRCAWRENSMVHPLLGLSLFAGAALAINPIPEPPVPRPSSGWFSSNVFWRGQQATSGDVYPCIRIPSLMQAGSGVLLAFAECRMRIDDGCFPLNITMM
jgi:hypothetical protein